MAVQSCRDGGAAVARGGKLHPFSKFKNYIQHYAKKAHEIRNNFIPWVFTGNSTVGPEFVKTPEKSELSPL